MEAESPPCASVGPPQPSLPPGHRCTREEGAFSFLEPTSVVLQSGSNNDAFVWQSRRHRKTRVRHQNAPDAHERDHITHFFGWQPNRFAYWTALLFFIGSTFFVVAGVLAVLPIAHRSTTHFLYMSSVPSVVGASFFVLGASAQYLEIVNSDPGVASQDQIHGAAHAALQTGANRTFLLWHWQPRRLGYWAAVVMWVGTLLFEVSAVLLVIPPVYSSVSRSRRYVWSCSTAGSVHRISAA